MSEQMKWGIIHTMDCSTIKRNNVLIHAKTWVNLKNISLKEKKPLTKYLKLYDSIYMKYPEQRQRVD